MTSSSCTESAEIYRESPAHGKRTEAEAERSAQANARPSASNLQLYNNHHVAWDQWETRWDHSPAGTLHVAKRERAAFELA
jgi:hypothetical protein